ncbi:redoxin domain-containing protein [Hyphomonas johnsonii]|jgi:cytochrome c biogenesis protein CcmG/thiol:disulfide interchange protein DsbE|uniref:Putative thiol:disulfide interchange protein n=1 Tax=Hyphomonas johnsonii MHS-2 TaxID=1280950 RepID=A0A059FMZ1_9PROT|nr:redoxin domain-containing protein [Hyphomonas johnsonii]KCZ91853.1 putative thiol:disulfide interchange protein [Hyphomonas johnsonii MHS-2]
MTRWLAALPVIALLLFAGLGLSQLLSPQKGEFERVSRDAPDRAFETMEGGVVTYSQPPGDAAIVVNLFASWCAPCEAEHPQLVALSKAFPGRVYGILYKDSPENGAGFLDRMGNPFAGVALDPDGQGGLDFGLTGVPETFVISHEGKILLHVPGPLDAKAVREVSGALNAPREP